MNQNFTFNEYEIFFCNLVNQFISLIPVLDNSSNNLLLVHFICVSWTLHQSSSGKHLTSNVSLFNQSNISQLPSTANLIFQAIYHFTSPWIPDLSIKQSLILHPHNPWSTIHLSSSIHYVPYFYINESYFSSTVSLMFCLSIPDLSCHYHISLSLAINVWFSIINLSS